MPVSKSVLGSGTSWPTEGIFAVVLVVVGVGLIGCDDPESEVEPRVADRHAGLAAVEEARLTVATARQLVLLSPDSIRQQQARDNLEYLREHRDRLGGEVPEDQTQPQFDEHRSTDIELRDGDGEPVEPRREEIR